MKGIDNIVKAILDDAKADVQATKDQTKQQIKQMKDKAKAEIEKQVSAMEKETAKKSEELKRREKTIMEVEIRRNNLMVKREMVDEAFSLAYKSLCELSPADYDSVVLSMIMEAADTGDEEVVPGKDQKISQKLVDEANARLKSAKRNGNLKLSKDTGDFTGGFVMRSKGIETNCTFSMLIGQLKPNLENQVANILFG
ncbi:MAG: V-type ATP synthase subunit E [Clostridia bacterium]|nr:V-type ATP synthase subunit E [Clostridia bacterium]